jgi:heme exporter protein D
MNWGSFANFLDMGGHGFFVWGSYGVFVACVALEATLAARRRHAALQAARDAGHTSGEDPA